MKQRKSAKQTIGISLLFAAAILAGSYFFKDSDNALTWTFVLIGLWWIPFTILTSESGSIKAEYQCLKRKFSSAFRSN